MRSLDEIKRENLDAARRAATAADRAPRIVCVKCDGIGHHRIAEPYANTYDVLTSAWQPTEVIREALHRRGDRVTRTALINRLNYLRTYHLVDSRRAWGSTRRREWRAR